MCWYCKPTSKKPGLRFRVSGSEFNQNREFGFWFVGLRSWGSWVQGAGQAPYGPCVDITKALSRLGAVPQHKEPPPPPDCCRFSASSSATREKEQACKSPKSPELPSKILKPRRDTTKGLSKGPGMPRCGQWSCHGSCHERHGQRRESKGFGSGLALTGMAQRMEG